jgi:hypothetical protein
VVVALDLLSVSLPELVAAPKSAAVLRALFPPDLEDNDAQDEDGAATTTTTTTT